MKTAYIDCGMGAAGDMLTAALLELLPAEERQAFVDEFNAAGFIINAHGNDSDKVFVICTGQRMNRKFMM